MARGGSSNEKIDRTICLDRPLYESPAIPIQIFKPRGITIRPFQRIIVDNSLISTKSYSLQL